MTDRPWCKDTERGNPRAVGRPHRGLKGTAVRINALHMRLTFTVGSDHVDRPGSAGPSPMPSCEEKDLRAVG